MAASDAESGTVARNRTTRAINPSQSANFSWLCELKKLHLQTAVTAPWKMAKKLGWRQGIYLNVWFVSCNKTFEQDGNSASNLAKHLRTQHQQQHLTVPSVNSHSNVHIDENDNFFELMEFEDALPNHVECVLICALNCEPFSTLCLQGERRIFILHFVLGITTCKLFVPCCFTVSNLILESIKQCCVKMMKDEQKGGSPFCCARLDMWTKTNCNHAFFGVSLLLWLLKWKARTCFGLP